MRKVLLLLSPTYKGGNGSTERLRILPEVAQWVSDRAPGSMLLNTELCCWWGWDCEILLSQVKYFGFILGPVKFADLYLWELGEDQRLSWVSPRHRGEGEELSEGNCECWGSFWVSRECGGSIHQDWMKEEEKVCAGGWCWVGDMFIWDMMNSSAREKLKGWNPRGIFIYTRDTRNLT